MGAPQNPLVNSVNTFGSGGWSTNNMMLAGLKHQFSHTFSADAQFTWAHSLDTNSGPYSRDPYLYNPRFSYGRSDFDINHTFKLFGVWQPVIFHGSNEWMEKAAGGWSLSGIMTLHSGFGWTPIYKRHTSSTAIPATTDTRTCVRTILAEPATAPATMPLRPEATSPITRDQIRPHLPAQAQAERQFVLQQPTSVFRTSAHAITDDWRLLGQSTTNYMPPPGIGRNTFPGPGYRDVDLTFGKAFGLPNMRVLGEGANVRNQSQHAQHLQSAEHQPRSLSIPTFRVPNLGQAGSALGASIVDFQARFSF